MVLWNLKDDEKKVVYFKDEDGIQTNLHSIADIMSAMVESMKDLHKKLDLVKAEISLNQLELESQTASRVITEIYRLRDQLAESPETVKESTGAIKYPKMKDSHKNILRLMLSKNAALSYKEIAGTLNMAVSSVRVYVTEMQNLGVIFAKRTSGNKVFIDIDSSVKQSVRDFLNG